MKQGNRVMVIAKAHGFTRLKRVQRPKNRGMTKAFGNATGVKWVNRLRGDVTGCAGTHGLSPNKFKDSL